MRTSSFSLHSTGRVNLNFRLIESPSNGAEPYAVIDLLDADNPNSWNTIGMFVDFADADRYAKACKAFNAVMNGIPAKSTEEAA